MKLRFIGKKKSRQVKEGKKMVYELTCTLDLEKFFNEKFGTGEVPARIRKAIQKEVPIYKFSCDKGCISDENGKKVDGFKVTANATTHDDDNFNEMSGRIISEGRAKEKAYLTASKVASIVNDFFNEVGYETMRISIETHLLRNTEHKRLRKFFSRMNKNTNENV